MLTPDEVQELTCWLSRSLAVRCRVSPSTVNSNFFRLGDRYNVWVNDDGTVSLTAMTYARDGGSLRRTLFSLADPDLVDKVATCLRRV